MNATPLRLHDIISLLAVQTHLDSSLSSKWFYSAAMLADNLKLCHEVLRIIGILGYEDNEE
jgi:hypothetical protein